jgi:hypothetical protein
MASIIRIKRSSVSGNPTTLGAGELAYSALTDNGSNGGDRLYIGMGSETSGNAANHIVIGGKYFTDLVSAATNSNTASAIVKRDSSGNFSAGTITATLSGSATSLATGRTIALTGDVTYTSSSFDGTGNVTGTATLANTAVTAGSYGSATAIPTFTVDSKGRLTAAGTASISTNLTVAADSGTADTVSLGSDTLTFAGGTGLDSAVSDNTITFNIDSTVTTLTGTQTLTNKTLTSPVMTTPSLGVATATSITGASGNLSITAASGNNTVSIAPTGTGTVDVNSKRISSLADPVNAQDAATKAYVDAMQTGLDVKGSVRAATTANITLSDTQTIDGVALSAGDRVLVKDQSSGAQNGIYVVASGASWSRATDANSDAEVTSGMFTFVEEGTTNADSGWVLSTNGTITVGTTALTFAQFSGAGQITAGTGLSKSGNTLSISNTYVGQTSITTLGTIGTGTWQGTAVGPAYGGTGVANNAANTITFTGNYSLGLTLTGNTSVTLPTSGTLVNSAVATLSSLTSIGTIGTGTWQGTTIATGYGGTGLTSYTTGDLIYASATNTLAKRAAGTDGQVLQMNSSGIPVWGDIDGGTY